MSAAAIVTRFAPSPSGALHLGNARTALFNALLARASPGGRFLLRVEDTDATRSRPEHAAQLIEDLGWLGLQWDGEVWHQSRRTGVYEAGLAQLVESGHAYPCFCTDEELARSRAAQVAAGRPPRYSGRCRDLPETERRARLAAGEPATLRFRVPASGVTAFDDLVHGAREFPHAAIGDFVLRRADGSAAFFFSNAMDDAASGVTHVLRGDDHLSNTPRQLLLLAALGLPAPRYGHIALLTDMQGAPLSKRTGAASLAMLREQGYLPEAVVNLLFRLGHSSTFTGFAPLAELAAHFDTAHLQRAPAHLDPVQLQVWQKEAVHRLDTTAAVEWLGARLPATLGERREIFVAAVLPNLVLPDDVLPWVEVVTAELPPLQPGAQQVIEAADPRLFAAAAAAAASGDFARIAGAAREATGLKGAALFKPLRAALTGRTEGPELGPLLKAIPVACIERRLARFA